MSTETFETHQAPDSAGNVLADALAPLPFEPVVINKGTRRSASIGNLALALSNVQGEMKNPPREKKVTIPGKDGRAGYTFMYAELSGCLDAVRPLLKENGLAIVQSVSVEAGRAICTSELIHRSGEWYLNELSFAGTGGIKDMAGSFTYLRRYGACALMGIAPEDDTDGGEDDHKKPEAQGQAGNAATRARATESKPTASTSRQAQSPKAPESAPKQAEKPAEAAPKEEKVVTTGTPVGDKEPTNPAAKHDPERYELARQLWVAVQACDQGYHNGQPDGPASHVKGDWRMSTWGLPVMAHQKSEHIRTALSKYTELLKLQKEFASLSGSLDAVTDANGVIDEAATLKATALRLMALSDGNPGKVGLHPKTKVPAIEYCTEEHLRWLIAEYNQASFAPAAAEEVPF